MARIRSIKPEFWTSEQITECSPNARLMFIGMWNFCDDYGVIPASAKRLKMQLFPADECIGSADVRRMIDELLANGLLHEYSIDSKEYWFVTGWDLHQKPDCKTGLYPRPNGQIGTKIRRKNTEDSPNVRQPFAQGEGEGEGEGKVKKAVSATADVVSVFEHWKVVMSSPKSKLDSKRKSAIKARLADGFSIEDLKSAINGCRKTPYNMGENERGQKYNDIELICRNAPNVERFIGVAKPTSSPVRSLLDMPGMVR